MNQIRTIIKKSFIALTIAVQVSSFSLINFSRVALADETAAETSAAAVPPAPTCPQVTGTTSPPGVGSHTFTFIPAPTCLWENTYYTWSPVTKAYTPKYDTQVCDSATSVCEKVNWQYVPSEGRYVERRSVITPTAAVSTDSATTTLPATTNTDDGASAQSTDTSIVSGAGSGSDNSITNNSNTTGNVDLTNNVSILTTLDSNATSGNATANSNALVGDVGTGDATTIANILNMIQSSWDPANGDFNVFSADLYDNYFGDLLFDPSIVLGTGSGSNNDITNDTNTDLTVNIEENASIENDINLNAQSGNATANGNAEAGNVSTGDATAIANVINMINSMITSGDSFIGSINLHGDLNGDILLPQSLMDILLGTGNGSSNSIANNQTTNIDADLTTNSSITNNTNLTASSGDANANGNAAAGNISTGNAETNVNEMNLVGQNVQGTKGLLVFVNVLGSWVGMLFGNPVTASIAGGTGANSTNTITNNQNTNADIDINRNYNIINNLDLNAVSGDAIANGNALVGNVSTGNATSSVNLLNMIDSQINFTDWFGVLFVNVFGSWNGSFGTNTAAGNSKSENNAGSQTQTGIGNSTGGTGHVAAANTSIAPGNVLNFNPRAFFSSNQSSDEDELVAAGTENIPSGRTSSASTSTNNSPMAVVADTAEAVGNNKGLWPSVIIGGVLALLLLGGERFLAMRRSS